jgi:RNA polymerase sigma-70 factor (ECF subfamily)
MVPEFDVLRLEEALESCRRFLLAAAIEELPPHLAAKGGASDLVQQTFAQAVTSEHQFRGRTLAELRAWLRAILRTEAAVFRRRFLQTAARDVRREVAIDGSLAQDTQTPVTAVLQSEQSERVAQALTQLPPEQYQAVVFRMEDELSFSEIGERLGKSEEAARKLFTRALDRLRGRLGEAGGPC